MSAAFAEIDNTIAEIIADKCFILGSFVAVYVYIIANRAFLVNQNSVAKKQHFSTTNLGTLAGTMTVPAHCKNPNKLGLGNAFLAHLGLGGQLAQALGGSDT
jgi:hypothetical protein